MGVLDIELKAIPANGSAFVDMHRPVIVQHLKLVRVFGNMNTAGDTIFYLKIDWLHQNNIMNASVGGKLSTSIPVHLGKTDLKFDIDYNVVLEGVDRIPQAFNVSVQGNTKVIDDLHAVFEYTHV